MKPKIKICPNGIIKFFNPDGTRNKDHATGFYNSKDKAFYKTNYEIIN